MDARLLGTAFGLALAARFALLWLAPENYSWDGYQRWAGRDHLLVQGWLPGTQALIWTTTTLGGGILATRVVLSVVAALAVVAGAATAALIGGPAAGWLFIPVGLFGPFLAWSVVPYQEGSYLLTVLACAAFSLKGKPRWAALAAGAAALIRYEGWLFAALYLAWKRDRASALAIWGIGLWAAGQALGWQGASPSPTDFADWEGLGDRFSLAALWASLLKGLGQLSRTGAWVVMGLGGLGAWSLRDRPGATLLIGAVVIQLCALSGWIVGLETTIYRMQVVPCVLLGVLGAAWCGQQWDARPGGMRTGMVLAAVIGSGLWFAEGHREATRALKSMAPERVLVTDLASCGDCVWWIAPRSGLGTRARHDGCEAVQGLTELVHGTDFWCQGWTTSAPSNLTHRAIWKKGGYEIRR